ncbi:MAG TPA: sulfotransferase domain-containing protein [Phycisphaerales bacterium]|nr:sulfotransferase domain-containing protein [Phycisphaerales bacterium]
MTAGSNHPTTIFVTMHKAASSFLAGSFGVVLARLVPGLEVVPFGYKLIRGTPAEAMALPTKGVVMTRVYPDHVDKIIEREVPDAGRFADKKLIVVRRDPRDVAISMYYSTAFSHPVPPGQEHWFLPLRKQLQEMSVCEGVKFHTAKQAIEEFKTISDVLAQFSHALDAPYELLVTRPAEWIRLVGNELGWDARISGVMTGLATQEVSAPKTENANQHKRRVTPGNWRGVFDDELRELFESEIGTLMGGAGYEWDAAAVGAAGNLH